MLQDAHRDILFRSVKHLDEKSQNSSWKSKGTSCELVRSRHCNCDTGCVVDGRRCSQGGGNGKKFLGTFSQRLKDCFGQSWHDKLESSDRFFEYKLMKQNFGMEEYLSSMKGHSRDALLRYRAGVSWIKAHRFRFKPGADTSCPFCPHETEEELHVLCKCTMYNNIRPDFLRRDGLRSSVPYHSDMETTNQCRLQQTALFLIKAGKMRQITD